METNLQRSSEVIINENLNEVEDCNDEKTYVTLKNVSTRSEQPAKEVANGDTVQIEDNVYYPCHTCKKLFKRKATSVTHIKHCTAAEDREEYHVDTTETDVNTEEITSNCVDSKSETAIQDSVNSTEIINLEGIRQSTSYTRSTQTEKHGKTSDIYDFDDEDDLETIEKTAPVPVELRCRFCSKVFDTALAVLRHKREKHTFPKIMLPQKEVEKYFETRNRTECPICHRPLQSKGYKSLYVKHLMTHTVGPLFQCKICKQTFRRKDHRASHERRHIVRVPPSNY